MWSAGALRWSSDTVRQIVLIRDLTVLDWLRFSSQLVPLVRGSRPFGNWRISRMWHIVPVMLNMSVHIFSFKYLLFDNFKVLGHLNILELFSLRWCKTSFICRFSRRLLVDTAVLNSGNLPTKRHKRFFLLDVGLQVVSISHLIRIDSTWSCANHALVECKFSMLKFFIKLCSIHRTFEINHTKSKWSLASMRITVNKMIMAFAFLLSLYRFESTWYFSISWKLHEVISNVWAVFAIPLRNVVDLLESVFIHIRCGQVYCMRSLLFEDHSTSNVVKVALCCFQECIFRVLFRHINKWLFLLLMFPTESNSFLIGCLCLLEEGFIQSSYISFGILACFERLIKLLYIVPFRFSMTLSRNCLCSSRSPAWCERLFIELMFAFSPRAHSIKIWWLFQRINSLSCFRGQWSIRRV